MNFIIYDIIFLVAFVIFLSIFLYTKKNLKREGLLLLYKTSWGIRLINYLGKKHKKTLKVLAYLSIFIGFILMITMVYLFGKIIWIYLFSPDIVRAIKIPPIMPLIPYLPRLFNLDFLPPFYFIYWIIIIAIIAIPHELAHGIYSAYSKVKIKNTGFGFFPYFLPIFLAAFVEPDEKQMSKTKTFNQMAILSSGTFANILTALLFFVLMWLFFACCFAPTGVVFDSYASSIVNASGISHINEAAIDSLSYDNLLDNMKEDINEIKTPEKTFLITKNLLEQNKNLIEKEGLIVLFDDSPAFRAGIEGAITKVNEIDITDRETLSQALLSNSPGDSVNIEMFDGENYQNYNVTLGEHPENSSAAWLGVGFIERRGSGIMGRVIDFVSFFGEPHVYYEPKFEFALFIYNLFWWIVLICFSVALINMLPIGIFDGGRFFFLAVAAVTGSQKIAKKAFMYLTYLFLLLLFMIMFFWFRSFI